MTLPPSDEKNQHSARYRFALRVVRTVMGFTVILVGLVLTIPGIPGPGLLIVIGGLAILATEYMWARRYLNKVKEGGEKLKFIFLPSRKPKEPADTPKS
jgi:tellurite resistance protein TerC